MYFFFHSGIAAVARKIKMNYANERSILITVGVDGTVYKKHPTFSKIMADKVKQLCADAGVNVDFALSYDGSGKGAALVTAVAHRLFHEKVKSGNTNLLLTFCLNFIIAVVWFLEKALHDNFHTC